MLHSTSHIVVLIGAFAVALLGLYVAKALWATFQTISEQRSDPSPATPFLLTAGALVTLAALGYLVYVTQVTGAA